MPILLTLLGGIAWVVLVFAILWQAQTLELKAYRNRIDEKGGH